LHHIEARRIHPIVGAEAIAQRLFARAVQPGPAAHGRCLAVRPDQPAVADRTIVNVGDTTVVPTRSTRRKSHMTLPQKSRTQRLRARGKQAMQMGAANTET